MRFEDYLDAEIMKTVQADVSRDIKKRTREDIRRDRKQMMILLAVCLTVIILSGIVSLVRVEETAEMVDPPTVVETVGAGEPAGGYTPATHVCYMTEEEILVEAVTLPDPYADDKIALAQMLYGECRGVPSTMRQAATVWVVLNRLDSGNPFYKGLESPLDIVAQPRQFDGYRSDNPVLPELYDLAEDVINRWIAEKYNDEVQVGRVIPANYTQFRGDGKENHFYDENGNEWDWSLPDPYTEEEDNG